MAAILIVEDDPQNRQLLATILKPGGYTIATASDGREGVAKAIADPPDLVLMDIRLPDISGIDAAKQIRAALKARPVTIIAVTASVMPEDDDAMLAQGFDKIIRKPVDIVELREEVARFLRLA